MNIQLITPQCGSSDKRNTEYEAAYSTQKFYDAIVKIADPVIFDVGAHQGESISFFRKLYPKSKIYSFEPEINNFVFLKNIANELEGCHVYNLALGEVDEMAYYYRQDISHLGGLLPINKCSIDSLGYAKNAKNEKIEIKKIRLDRFCAENCIEKIHILKIDVQGFESQVLKGSVKMLEKIDCISVELSFYDFYEISRSSLLEVEKIMVANGFYLWDISKISKNPMNLRTDWAEFIYRKK